MKKKWNTPVLAALVLAAVAVTTERVEAQAGYTYVPVTPCRAVDTRYGFGGPLVPGVRRDFVIKGTCGVPSNAVAVTLNIAVLGPTGPGHMRFWSADTALPPTSNINFNGGETAVSNGVVVTLAVSLSPDLATYISGGGTPNLVLDVSGYYK